MADVPRDPRQLARDILSGKVKIEDLQRERQMRAGGASQVPAKIPLPRQNPQPQQRSSPHQRPIPQQRQTPLPRPGPQRGPVTIRQPQRQAQTPPPPARMPAPARASMPPVVVQQPTLQQPNAAYDLPTVLSSQAQVSAGAKKELRLHQLMRSNRAVRQGIMMAEILGKPLSLRDH